MTNRAQRCLLWPILVLISLLLFGCGGGGGGSHHNGGGGGGGGGGSLGRFSCTNSTPYVGDQIGGGGGEMFGWCVSDASNTFSFTDLTMSGAPVNGSVTANSTFSNLLNLSAAGNNGTAIEMPGTALLVNPGSLLTSETGSANPVATIFQQLGFCPSSGNNYQFVILPKPSWIATKPAYGTVDLSSSSSLTLNSFDLAGKAKDVNVPFTYTCDSTKALLKVTDSSNNSVWVATSPQGLLQVAAGNGEAGLLRALSSTSSAIAAGTFLGVIYQPNTANPPQTVGFKPGGCAAALCGFDPLTAGQPSNGMTLDPGAESSFGLFTNGTLVDTNTDTPLVIVANPVLVNGVNKLIFYGVTFDTTANTPVAMLFFEQ